MKDKAFTRESVPEGTGELLLVPDWSVVCAKSSSPNFSDPVGLGALASSFSSKLSSSRSKPSIDREPRSGDPIGVGVPSAVLASPER